jgi:hypothetical protein
MALRVPTYEPQTQVQNLPGVRVQAMDTSAGVQGLMAGLQQVGAVANQYAQQEREKADAAQLLEADRALAEWENSTLYAPETGLLNRRGKDALGIPDEALPSLDKRISEAEQGLRSDAARMRFRALAQGRRTDIERQLMRHVSSQSDAILKAETDAYQATALSAIAVHAQDPERVALETERLWAAKSVALERMGMPEEAIRAERQATMQAVHGTVIDSLLSRNEYAQAVGYFEQHRDALGDRMDEYGKAVKQADYALKEASESDRIMRQFGTGRAAVAEARRIEDIFLRDRVESRIEREATRRDREVREAEKAVRESAWAKIERAAPGADLYSVLTPRELANLSEMPGVLSQMEGRMKQRLQGLQVQTDPRVFDQLHRMMDQPQEFADADLSQFYDQLSPSDRDYFRKAQASMTQPGKQVDFASESDQLRLIYTDLGVSPTAPKDGETRGLFLRQYYAEKDAFIQQAGRPPNANERQEMMRRLMLPFVRERTLWFDQEKRAFQIPPGQEGRFTIPRTERQQIVAAFQKNGVDAPTDQQIFEAYLMAGGR